MDRFKQAHSATRNIHPQIHLAGKGPYSHGYPANQWNSTISVDLSKDIRIVGLVVGYELSLSKRLKTGCRLAG